jgi:AraC-like DNA-binding protein
MAECPRAQAALHSRSIVIATPHLVSGLTRRPTITLLVSLDAQPFALSVNGGAFMRSAGAIVAENQWRQLDARGCDLISISLEPGHPMFLPLQQALAHRPCLGFGLPGDSFHALAPGRGPGSGKAPDDELLALLCGWAGIRLKAGRSSAGRGHELLEMVDRSLPDLTSASTLARAAGLSTSRLSHVFVKEIGMPLRTYSLWRRYRLALQCLGGAPGLGHLASGSGFADAAHMTRTFVQYLGFPPSHVAQRCAIQVR